jgi:hypothetical protein
MGRIADLFTEVAATAQEGPDGYFLAPEDWERLREQEWDDDDIEDTLVLVRENLARDELVEAADSLGSRLMELLGTLGEAAAFAEAEKSGLRLGMEAVDGLARRAARLDEVLEVFREETPGDRRGFEALRARLADQGIEEEMGRGTAPARGH